MEYQALYRKYRPNTFEGVVGQEHITTILKNQVETGHTSHAYLFSGTRGTGKTSTAKILAKAVNCLHPIDGEPCNECEACCIAPDANVDIIELDAASNNGVDDMRSLIEKAVFAPVRMKKKVYIIDEAHMLSGAAFNALLKTLEEPPTHVMFILATTEPHKIIPTITSRCQRFDFRRLRSQDIIGCLKSVLEKAGAQIESEGLLTIAKKANGGMRDALSLADQCISFCGSHVTAKDVLHVLGSADFDEIYSVVDVLIQGEAAHALTMLDKIIAGRDMSVLMQDLISHFRTIMLAKMCGDCIDILDCTAEDMEKITGQAAQVSEERLLRAIEVLTKAQTDMKYYPQPRVLIETAFVRVCRPEHETSIEAALDRIDMLEKQIKDGVTIKQNEKTSKYKEPEEKSTPPEKKKRVATEDAVKVYRELCDALTKDGSFGMFIASSFTRAVDAQLTDTELRVHFADKTHYNTSKDHTAKLDSLLERLNYDLKTVLVLENADENSEIEECLLEQFGEMRIVD